MDPITTGGYTANAMYDNIRGGYGAGYGQFASPSANAVRINRNEGVTRDSAKCLQGTLGAGLDRVSAQNFEGRIDASFAGIRDGQFQAELRNGDRLRDIEREMNANARIAATCCCDTQKEILKMQALNDKCCCETRLEISQSESRLATRMEALDKAATSRDLDRAERQLVALNTQIACGCCPPSPCHPHPS